MSAPCGTAARGAFLTGVGRVLDIFFEKIKKIRHAIDKSKILCYNSKGRYAAMAQLVEHILGKDEVISSNLISSSRKPECVSVRVFYFFGLFFTFFPSARSFLSIFFGMN